MVDWDAGTITGVTVGSLILAIFSCCFAVRRKARLIVPEDTSTVCGISKLGMICKLSNVCGHPVPRVEAARFSFFPAATTDFCDDHAAPRPEKHQRGARSGGISSLERIHASKSSDVLVVAFSGGATNKIGLARLEFRRMLSRYEGVDQLYVLDPTGMSFYEHNIRQFQTQLARCLSPYSKVVLLGNCMGATAALRFSSLLQHHEDFVLAFNPEVVPARDPRCMFRIAACLSPSRTSRLRAVLETAVVKTPAKIRIHASNWPPERSQAMLLLADNCKAEDMFDVDFDTVAKYPTSLPRLVRILHRECNHHGLLAKRLKGNGALQNILDQAVM